MTTNIRIDGERLWGSLMELAKIGATEKGGVCRLALTDLDRQARDLFVRWCEGGGLHRHGRPDRQHLRAPARARQHSAAGDDRQPSRHPADRRQVRRRLRRDGGARGGAHAATISTTRRSADRGRGLDQRGGLALRAGHGGLGRVRRRLRCSITASARKDVDGKSMGEELAAHRLCRRRAGRRPPGRRLLRGAYRAGADPGGGEARRSASSPARRASAGTRSP